jgi:hypothetical protein
LTTSTYIKITLFYSITLLDAKNSAIDSQEQLSTQMYHRVFFTALVLCICYAIALRPQHGIKSSSQTVLRTADYTFRNAIKEDIDDIITVFLDAFSPSPSWRYLRPEYQKYKDYIWSCMQANVLQQWDHIDTNTTFIKVVAVPDTNAFNGRNERVVAVGVWFIMTRNDTAMSATNSFLRALQNKPPIWDSRLDTSDSSTKYNCSANLDLNLTRAADYQRQFTPEETRYIDEAYPEQLYLSMLATHPDWDGHGFAAMNLHWGIELAKTLDNPVTLIATPAGYPLYDDTGFQSLKNISIQTLDGWGQGSLWYEVMEY